MELLRVSGDLARHLGNLLLCGHLCSSVFCIQFAIKEGYMLLNMVLKAPFGKLSL